MPHQGRVRRSRDQFHLAARRRDAQDRLGNDPVTEGLVVRQQLGEIAVLRLQDLLADLVAGPAPAGAGG